MQPKHTDFARLTPPDTNNFFMGLVTGVGLSGIFYLIIRGVFQ